MLHATQQSTRRNDRVGRMPENLVFAAFRDTRTASLATGNGKDSGKAAGLYTIDERPVNARLTVCPGPRHCRLEPVWDPTELLSRKRCYWQCWQCEHCEDANLAIAGRLDLTVATKPIRFANTAGATLAVIRYFGNSHCLMADQPFIPLCVPSLSGSESKYVQQGLDSTFVSSVGPFVDRFEQQFAQFVGSRCAVACSSGTAALHVAMRLLDIGPGDEVLVPTLTFIASANPIAYERATPVFVDAEPRTWNLDCQAVVEEIQRRAAEGLKQPKAVEVVHILGHPAEMAELVDVCDRHGVAIIEDAAESLGASYCGGPLAGKHVGTIGRIGCFSFNGNKIMTTGGGGMLVTDDELLARRAKHLTTQAKLPGVEYRHDEIGYNYRLTNLAAAMGVAQLEQMPTFLDRKRAIAERYDRALGAMPGITIPPRAHWADPSCWLYTILIDAERFGTGARDLIAEFEAAAIQTRPIWQPLHCQPMFRDAPRLGGDIAEQIAGEGLSLPCSVDLTPQDQDRVLAVIGRCAERHATRTASAA
jgi:aminotransferase in exopolysaccharide biosynthesis